MNPIEKMIMAIKPFGRFTFADSDDNNLKQYELDYEIGYTKGGSC